MKDEIKEKCVCCKFSRQCVTAKQINSNICLKDDEKIKEILDNIEVNELKHHKWYCSVEKDNMQKILDYITNLEQIANARMKTIIKIEQYLIDNGIDDEMLKCCDIYDINGIELKKYIEELKNGGDEE